MKLLLFNLKQRRHFSRYCLGILTLALLACQGTEARVNKNAPHRLFKGDTSSPMLIMTGLRDGTDYVVARIHDRKSSTGDNAREPGTPSVVSLKADVHDLKTLFLRQNKLEGVRAIAVPEFKLNRTSTLRLALWYPCDDPPEELEVVTMPCFFDRLKTQEYGMSHVSTVSRDRKATLYVRHHPVDPEAEYMAMGGPMSLEDGGSGDDIPFVEKYTGPTTRVSCWLPSAGAIDHDALVFDATQQSHRLRITNLYYRRPYRADGDDEAHDSDDNHGNTMPNDLDPSVWYGLELAQDTPVDNDAATIEGTSYCRSWLLVSVPNGESAGWTTVSPQRNPVSESGSMERHRQHH